MCVGTGGLPYAAQWEIRKLPLEGAVLISPLSLPIPAKSDALMELKMFRRSVWRAYFKSSAIDALVCRGEKGLCLLTEETDANVSRCLSFSISLLPLFQQAQCPSADGKRQTSSSDFHPIDCQAKALQLLTAFLFFLPVGQLSCPFWRSPFCQPALVHPCPVHANQTLPQRQDKEKGN